jgi:hypothetical protein
MGGKAIMIELRSLALIFALLQIPTDGNQIPTESDPGLVLRIDGVSADEGSVGMTLRFVNVSGSDIYLDASLALRIVPLIHDTSGRALAIAEDRVHRSPPHPSATFPLRLQPGSFYGLSLHFPMKESPPEHLAFSARYEFPTGMTSHGRQLWGGTARARWVVLSRPSQGKCADVCSHTDEIRQKRSP